MTHFSKDPSHVRVDFFRAEHFKWYTTEEVPWLTWSYDGGKGLLIQDAFLEALRNHLRLPTGGLRLSGMLAVCLDPYYENDYPIAVTVPAT